MDRRIKIDWDMMFAVRPLACRRMIDFYGEISPETVVDHALYMKILEENDIVENPLNLFYFFDSELILGVIPQALNKFTAISETEYMGYVLHDIHGRIAAQQRALENSFELLNHKLETENKIKKKKKKKG